jgi:hypothetical protein
MFTFSIQDLKTKYSELNDCQLNLILQRLLGGSFIYFLFSKLLQTCRIFEGSVSYQ